MKRKLVPFDGFQYSEVDTVALSRTAKSLLEIIETIEFPPGEGDKYKIYKRLIPILRRAIAGDIVTPFRDKNELLGGLYHYEYMEGTLPQYLTSAFQTVFVKFAVIALSMPLDVPEEVIVDGVLMAWVDFEEEGDWPSKVKYP